MDDVIGISVAEQALMGRVSSQWSTVMNAALSDLPNGP